jgi:hypothetical protein
MKRLLSLVISRHIRDQQPEIPVLRKPPESLTENVRVPVVADDDVYQTVSR